MTDDSVIWVLLARIFDFQGVDRGRSELRDSKLMIGCVYDANAPPANKKLCHLQFTAELWLYLHHSVVH